MDRDNFYILLELPVNPPEENPNKIEAAISKKRIEWSKLRNHPTKGRKAQLYLGLIEQIRLVMLDGAQRRTEAELAREFFKEAEKKKNKDLDGAIEILSSKGKITGKEIENLVKKFPTIPEAEIRKRIKVPIITDGKEKPKFQKEILDPVKAKKISDALEILKKDSLYEFLNMEKSSTLQVLQSESKKKYAELRRNSIDSAESRAEEDLQGLCDDVFKTEDSRRAYDNTLALAGLAGLDQSIELAGSEGKISPEVYDGLVKKGMSLGTGLGKDDVCDHIEKICKKKNILIQAPVSLSVDRMKQCGVCGLVNPPSSHNCQSCGYHLEVECPKCKNTCPSRVYICAKCGFALGDMPNARRLIREGKFALAGGDVGLAFRLLKQAEVYWPGNPEAAATLQEIQFKRNTVEKLAQEIQEQLARRCYYQARQLLVGLKQSDPSHPALSCEREINKKINAAEAWVKKARAFTSEDQVIDAYTAALGECKDCREAADGLSKLPPGPPIGLQAGASQRSISLQWSPCASKGEIAYRLVRKVKAPPSNVNDGDILGETAHTIFDDPDAEAGQFYYYAVFSVRGGVSSRDGAIAGPVMRVAEIDGLRITPADSCINLSWKTPNRARAIEVWRKEGAAPATPGDGRKLPGVRLDGVADAGLENGRLYGYLLITVFQDFRGENVLSSGITCQSMPVEPPQPVKDLAIKKRENNLLITWAPPLKGTVQLFHAAQPFQLTSGESLPTSSLSDLGASIPVQGKGSVLWPVSFQGTVHILPVTVDGDIAVVGEAVAATSLSEVSDLCGQIVSGGLYLEWTWPAGVQEVLVAYKHGISPDKPNDSAATQKLFTRKQYEKESGFVIRKLEDSDYHFTVFVVSGEGAQRVYSAGQKCLVVNGGLQEVFYEIKIIKGLFGKIKSATLILTSDKSNVGLPEAVLVKKSGNLPLRKTDGEVICTVTKGAAVGKSPVVVEIPTVEINKNSYAKLFLSDDSQAQKYRLISPGKEKLRLG